MSGIYIPGMEMPKTCGDCLRVGWNYVFECRIDDVEEDERLSSCPLIPVPDHGRLVDADAFFNDFPEVRDYEYASQEYDVLPADKEAGE